MAQIELQTKSINFEIKSIDEEAGTFTAYGNTFGNVDDANDRTIKGAFTKCINDWKAKGKYPRLLSQHGHRNNPIGVITSMTEDDHGLLFEGKFCIVAGTAGAEAYALVKMGALDSFSIGFNTKQFRMINGVRELLEVDVQEISLVTFACNDQSLIQSVKSQTNENGDLMLGIKETLEQAGVSARSAEAAITAIKATNRLNEDKDIKLVEFKSKVEEHQPSLVGLDAKSMQQSLGEYARTIHEAVTNAYSSGNRYVYCEAIYMDFVILCVWEEDEHEYEEYHLRVPYAVDEQGNVLVGADGTKVEMHVMWLTSEEKAKIDDAFAPKKENPETKSEEPETKSEEPETETEEGEAITEEVTVEEEEVTVEEEAETEVEEKSNTLTVDEIKSWFQMDETK